MEWMDGKNVYLVTGSDKEKTIEQIGIQIWKKKEVTNLVEMQFMKMKN